MRGASAHLRLPPFRPLSLSPSSLCSPSPPSFLSLPFARVLRPQSLTFLRLDYQAFLVLSDCALLYSSYFAP